MISTASPTIASLVEVLEAGIAQGVAPAMSAVVLAQGLLVHESWHGQAALIPTPRPLTRDAVFDLASLTKVVCTTTLCAMLTDEGRLDLDASVATILPEAEAWGPVTIRHLLAHTSGLPAWRPYYELVPRHDAVTGTGQQDAPDARDIPDSENGHGVHNIAHTWAQRRELVQRAVFAETLEAPPGTRVVYSDVGFLVLGWIVETLLGETLASAFAKRVAAPLGLQNTFFVDAAAPATTGAHRQAGARPCETLSRPFVATENCEHRPEINCGTVNDDNAWAVGGVAGHAGLFSTAREVAYVGQDWLSALLGRRALLRPATATYFATRDEIVGSTRALGWDTPSAQESSIGTLLGRGRRGAIGHLGFTGTSLWIDIDRELVCVLLTNRVHPSRANQAIKAFRPRFHDAVARGCELGSER